MLLVEQAQQLVAVAALHEWNRQVSQLLVVDKAEPPGDLLGALTFAACLADMIR